MANIDVEVVYASEENHKLIRLSIAENSSIREAIIKSEILTLYPELVLDKLKVGIFSKLKLLDDKLVQGDRVEIYRELTIDPKELRRQKAKAKK